MLIRYFDASIDGATRIAVVEAPTLDAVFSAPEAQHSLEIPASDLPADFATWTWQRCTTTISANGSRVLAVKIMSRDGG
jgi:hypothetical protein